ncbi:MAG: glycosyltransferase family 4 protein [Actinobacteria bacterium]|nr:glycosyltransferase family 4 protein [Actinomycetota bacterium]
MRVLILNWRAIRSPRAGGAEVLTHEIARRLVRGGHEVTWASSRPTGLAEREDVDGVEVLRRGSEVTTRLTTPRLIRDPRWDVVVEEINTLPYWSPLLARSPVVLFMAQLAREVWWYEAPRWLAPIGYAAEPLFLRPYRKLPVITISESTKSDLRGLRFSGEIDVIPMAAEGAALPALEPKRPRGRLVAVGRLVPSKRFEHAIRALAALRAQVPEATLVLVGDGPERRRLGSLAAGLGLNGAVRFAGRVPEDEKRRILQEADVVLATSVREGWGLTVTEGARLGTPAVAYDGPGLRDSVVDGQTGVLTPRMPEAMAAAVAALLRDGARYERLRENAWRHSSALTWDGTAAAFERTLSAVAGT